MAKKAKVVTKEEVLVHARISNPIFVRKTLLESAILGAEILKGYERIKKLEVTKISYRSQVRKIIRELRELVNELETEKLPKVPHINEARPVIKESFKPKEIREIKTVRFTKTHTDVLDEEIRRLQERINKL